MSAIRHSSSRRRNTRRRVIGVTGSLTLAGIETIAVVSWFGLVVDSRTAVTALIGLSILLCGSLLRTGVFGLAASEGTALFEPPRIAAALALTTGWLVWLLVAESVGDLGGIVTATAVLTGVLIAQLFLEQRVCHHRLAGQQVDLRALVGPATLLAVGSTALLASAWLTDWTMTATSISLAATTVVIHVNAVQIGAGVFGLFAFLAHQLRFQHALDP